MECPGPGWPCISVCSYNWTCYKICCTDLNFINTIWRVQLRSECAIHHDEGWAFSPARLRSMQMCVCVVVCVCVRVCAYKYIATHCATNWCRYCQLHDERLPKPPRGEQILQRSRSQLSCCLQNWIRDECTCIFHSTAAIWMPVLTLTRPCLTTSFSSSLSLHLFLCGQRVHQGELSCCLCAAFRPTSYRDKETRLVK